MVNKKEYSLAELAIFIDAKLEGKGSDKVNCLSSLQSSKAGSITFITSKSFRHFLDGCEATAVILSDSETAFFGGNRLIVKDPYLSYAKISHLFSCELEGGVVSSSADIAKSADINSSALIGSHVVIGERVEIASGVRIGAGSVIGDGCIIGKDTVIYPNVTLYHGVTIGSDCIIHSGTVIGSDGFGYVLDDQVWMKIAQLGFVVIGDCVEIGSNCAIDRGALDDTQIHDGVKMDNQIHVAHNVIIGENTAIAGCTGISGSTRIGKNCTVGGGSCFAGHLDIADGSHFAGVAMVTKSITKPGQYSSSGVGCMSVNDWRKNTVRFRQLDDIARRLRSVEKKV